MGLGAFGSGMRGLPSSPASASSPGPQNTAGVRYVCVAAVVRSAMNQQPRATGEWLWTAGDAQCGRWPISYHPSSCCVRVFQECLMLVVTARVGGQMWALLFKPVQMPCRKGGSNSTAWHHQPLNPRAHHVVVITESLDDTRVSC
jgi:hypothetical protein